MTPSQLSYDFCGISENISELSHDLFMGSAAQVKPSNFPNALGSDKSVRLTDFIGSPTSTGKLAFQGGSGSHLVRVYHHLGIHEVVPRKQGSN